MEIFLVCLVITLQRKCVPEGSQLPGRTYCATHVTHGGAAAPGHAPRVEDFSTYTAELMSLLSAHSHSTCPTPTVRFFLSSKLPSSDLEQQCFSLAWGGTAAKLQETGARADGISGSQMQAPDIS